MPISLRRESRCRCPGRGFDRHYERVADARLLRSRFLLSFHHPCLGWCECGDRFGLLLAGRGSGSVTVDRPTSTSLMLWWCRRHETWVFGSKL